MIHKLCKHAKHICRSLNVKNDCGTGWWDAGIQARNLKGLGGFGVEAWCKP